jgi:hypothetical protein
MNHSDGQSQNNNNNDTWKQFYAAALLEVDSNLLPQRIAEAEKAIAERAALLGSSGDYNSEIYALKNAHVLLNDLKRIYSGTARTA